MYNILNENGSSSYQITDINFFFEFGMIMKGTISMEWTEFGYSWDQNVWIGNLNFFFQFGMIIKLTISMKWTEFDSTNT